jgi:hypothetical protein
MYPFDTDTIHTAAGDYVLDYCHDENADQPYDEGFTLLTNGESHYGHDSRIDIEDGDKTDPVVRTVIQALSNSFHRFDHVSGAAILRYVRLAGKQGATLVDFDYTPVEPSLDRENRVYGVAWAPDDAHDHDRYTRLSLQQWHAWAEGETFGWKLIDPSGNEVESVWGYFDTEGERAYILEEARNLAQADAEQRIANANLAGAGIAQYPVEWFIDEGIPLPAGTVITIVCTPSAATPFTWEANLVGVEV